MIRPVHTLLLVENVVSDRERYRCYLMSDANCTYRLLEAESAAAGLELCWTQTIDAILLDGQLPDADGLEFLEALYARSDEDRPPVVMLADGDGTVPSVTLSTAIRAIKLGAEDYLLKHLLTPESLQTAIRSAIENARLRLQLRQCDNHFRVSIENMLDCFGIFSAIRDESGQIIDFRFDYLNAAALSSNGMTQADMSRTLCEVFPAHHETGLFADYCRVVETGEPLVREDLIYSDTFGTQYLTRAYDVRVNKLGDGLVISWRDVTERKQTKIALQTANQQITTIWESMTDAYVTLDREWRVVYANSAATQVFRQLTGLEPEEFLGKSHWEIFPSLVGQPVEQAYHQAVTDQVAAHLEVFYEPTGSWFEAHAYPSTAGLGIYLRDISERKTAEAIVQQQLTEIESIYTTAPIGLCFVDTDLRFVRINERLAEINGLPVSEHLGRTLREILPEMADQLEPLYRQVIDSGEPILNLEVAGTNRAQAGVLRHWLVCFYPQKNLHQRVVGVNVMVQEITERKQTQLRSEFLATVSQALTSTTSIGALVQTIGEHLNRYLNTSCFLIAEVNEPANEVIVRQTWHLPEAPNLTGVYNLRDYATDQLLGAVKAGQPIIYRDVTAEPDHIVDPQRYLDLGIGAELNMPFVQDGEWKFSIALYHSTPYNWRDDQIELMRELKEAIWSQIERIRAETARCESEQRLQAIIDNSNAAIFMKDVQGRYLLMNRECERLFNITNNWICGKTDYDLFPQAIAEALRENDRQVLASGKALTLEEEVPLEDGIHTYITVKFPLLDQAGIPYAICGISTDISDRVRLQAEAEAAREEAEAANRSKDEFVAIVAHELRSPLNAIQGWAKLLQARKFDETTLSKALDTITRNTQAQVQLVEDLLDISRIVKGTLQITLAPVNLGNVVEAALDIVRPMADAKHIQLEPYLTLTPQISGDFNRLQQIAVNLFTNAIKFTPDGGRVGVQLEQIDTQVLLRVQDTGKGIAPKFLPQIFERFKQGQRNTGSKDGLGLGLAIVKTLVELHGGTITAESAGIDQGATFTVRLPRLETPAMTQESFTVDSTYLAGIRILVVDDEPDMLDLIRFVLQDFGAEVQAVNSATAALECLSQFQPDILISDIAMPGGNGYELVQQIKSYPAGQIPAIALTSYASSTYRERSLLAGFQQHLSKPVEPRDLVAAILNLVRGDSA